MDKINNDEPISIIVFPENFFEYFFFNIKNMKNVEKYDIFVVFR